MIKVISFCMTKFPLVKEVPFYPNPKIASSIINSERKVFIIFLPALYAIYEWTIAKVPGHGIASSFFSIWKKIFIEI